MTDDVAARKTYRYVRLGMIGPSPCPARRCWSSAKTCPRRIWDEANTALKEGVVREELLGALLAARDRLGQVILGDPTVLLAPTRA
jgi:hypothetical protein